MKEGSMIEAACRILERNGEQMTFADLWSAVRADLEMDDVEANARIGFFYTDLSMNGQVIPLGNNTWDLRKRHKHEKASVDIQAVYSEVDQSSDDEYDRKDEEEYNRFTQGGTIEETPVTDDSEDGDNPRKDDDDGYLDLGKKESSDY